LNRFLSLELDDLAHISMVLLSVRLVFSDSSDAVRLPRRHFFQHVAAYSFGGAYKVWCRSLPAGEIASR